MAFRKLINAIDKLDRRIVALFNKYGHVSHRVSLGLLLIWFGLLKPFGHNTTTSLLAHTVYWGEPATIVPLLGWWEVAIGVCLVCRPLVRLALLLLFIPVPGTVLAFFMHPDVCFSTIPWVPTPAGQYLIKDLVILFAAIVVGASVREENSPHKYH